MFFNELERRKGEIGLTDAQIREFSEPLDYFPSWGDLALFPLTKGLL